MPAENGGNDTNVDARRSPRHTYLLSGQAPLPTRSTNKDDPPVVGAPAARAEYGVAINSNSESNGAQIADESDGVWRGTPRTPVDLTASSCKYCAHDIAEILAELMSRQRCPSGRQRIC